MAEQEAEIRFARRDLDTLMETVFGNGHPGLKMTVHEHSLLLTNWKASIDQYRKLAFGVATTLVAAAIIAVCASLFTAYKAYLTATIVNKIDERQEETLNAPTP